MLTEKDLRKWFVDEKLHMEEIARRAGCSRSTVRYQLIKAGIPLGERATIDREAVKRLYENGMSPYAIAEQLGYSQAGVRSVLLSLGIKTRGMSEAHLHRTELALGFVPSKEIFQRFLDENGGNAALAADAAGVKYPTFYGYLRKYGIEASGVRTSALLPKSPGALCSEKEAVLQSLNIRSCQVCGEERAFEMAHIYSNRTGGPMEEKNVLILCPTHHTLFDAGRLFKGEFLRIKTKVRAAEKFYKFKFSHYEEW